MDNKDTTGIRCLLSVSVKYRELLAWARWEVIWLQTMRILRKRVLFTLSYFLRYSYQIFTCISTQSKYFLSSYGDQMFMRISIHVETPSDSQTSQILSVLWIFEHCMIEILMLILWLFHVPSLTGIVKWQLRVPLPPVFFIPNLILLTKTQMLYKLPTLNNI